MLMFLAPQRRQDFIAQVGQGQSDVFMISLWRAFESR